MTSPDYPTKVDALVGALRDVLLELGTAPPVPPVPPGPIPPGSPFFFEPADLPVLCELRNGLLVPNWYEEYNAAGNARVVNGVVEFYWPKGKKGGEGVGMFWHPLPAVRKVYVGARVCLADDWQNHEAGMSKLFYVRTNGAGDIPFVLKGGPSGPYSVYCYPQFHAPNSSGPWLGEDNGIVIAGLPFVLEVWLDMADRRVQWAVDGGGVYTVPVKFPPDAMAEFQLNPVWGGANDTKDQEDLMTFSALVVSGQ